MVMGLLQTNDPARRLDAAIRLMVSALVVQVGISWAAWAPGGRGFPRTPVLPDLNGFGPEGLWLLAGGLGAAWLWWRPRTGWGTALLAGAMAALVMADVNRLQPWLYLYGLALVALQMAGGRAGRGPEGLAMVRLLIGFAWLWSGIMKLNPAFAADYFPGLMEPFGLRAWAAGHAPAAFLAGGIEAVAGVLFLIPRLQKWGLAGGLLVHAFILASLGPLGLNWNEVVWPWNLAFMGMAALATLGPRESRTAGGGGWGKILVVCLAGLMPAFNLAGGWDHFLSHSYYSGRVPMTVFYFHPEDRFHIPESARPYVLQAEGEETFFLPLEIWALGELKIPGYPEVWVRKNTAARLCACLEFPEKAGLEIAEKHGQASSTQLYFLDCAQLQRNDGPSHFITLQKKL
jgi:uncharacterized membrane protein YphA (DoxX/SURF4 family)